jgi:DnaJ like chaperone protein
LQNINALSPKPESRDQRLENVWLKFAIENFTGRGSEPLRDSAGPLEPLEASGPYQDSALPPPPQEEEPLDVVKVVSLKQAFAILELPPGRTTLSAAKRAYRQSISQYHPDRVAHLGPELRELAAKKTLQINLAWAFIQAHSAS